MEFSLQAALSSSRLKPELRAKDFPSFATPASQLPVQSRPIEDFPVHDVLGRAPARDGQDVAAGVVAVIARHFLRPCDRMRSDDNVFHLQKRIVLWNGFRFKDV